MKSIKQALLGIVGLAGSALLLAGTAHAAEIGNLPGGPAVNELNLQPPVTSVAQELYHLHTLMLLICLAIFIGVFGVMFYSIFAHRKSKGAKPAHFHESTTVEVIWTIVPLLIVIAMAIPATHAVIAMKNTSDSYLTVKVTGYQWKWGYDYISGPGAGISFLSTLTTPRAEIDGRAPITDSYLQQVDHPLVVPVGKKVRIITTSDDVVHSWSVPAFGVKQDAFPGMTRETWFKVDKVGTYHGFCTELCGKDHAFMPVVVDVVPEEEYLKWVKLHGMVRNDSPQTDLPHAGEYTYAELFANGQKVFLNNCAVCHQASGQGVGPFPKLVGDHIVNGPLVKTIGFVLHGKGQMPAWGNELNDVDMASVITYVRNSWGNHNPEAVQPSEVAQIRSGAGTKK